MAIFDKVKEFLSTPLPGAKRDEKTVAVDAPKGEEAPKAKAMDVQAEMHKSDTELRKATKAAADDKLRDELLAERRKLRELRRKYEDEMSKQAAVHAEAEETTYTVAAGDSLWKIAARFYDNGAEWPRIHEANKDKISNPNMIYPGQTFVIPADED